MSVTLAEIAIHLPVAIDLFEKYGFNYYQNGKQPFREACEEKGLDFAKIDAELNDLQKQAKKGIYYTLEDMSAERLMDFINGQYHHHEHELLAGIRQAITSAISNTNDPVLLRIVSEVSEKFRHLSEKLMRHCEKEDRVLFPYFRSLNALKHERPSLSSEAVSLLHNPVQILEAEHEEAARILEDIRRMTLQYKQGSPDEQTYNTLMEKLHDFERGLHMHLHLENNLLFPKLEALEADLTRKLKTLA